MKRIEFWALVLVVLVAIFFRFYHFESTPPGLYPDEAMNGNNALEAIKTGPLAGGFKVFYPENNGREGLMMNLQALSLMVTGLSEPWALRLPSPIFGVLTVLGFFFLLLELGGSAKLKSPLILAFSGSFFLAVSYWHITFSRLGFRAIMAPLFLIFALYFFLVSLRKNSFRYSLAAGLMLGLGAYTYIAFRIMPFLFLVFVPYFWRRRGFWHLAFGLYLSALIVAIPLLYYFGTHPADFLGRTTQVSIFHSPTPARDLAKNIVLTLGMFNVRGDGNWRHNYSGRPELFWPVGLLFLLGIGIAVKRRNIFGWTMTLMFLLALLPVVISNEGLPHALRSILLIPPAFGFAASGALWLCEYIKLRLTARHLAIVSVLILLGISAYTFKSYFLDWASRPEVADAYAADYVALGRQLDSLPDNVDKYIVVQARGVEVRGIPMPAQTVMFITDTFLPVDQARRHFHYLLPNQYEALKPSLNTGLIFFIR
ncbi:MAG: glycosyltransferase family 39 protein [Candidatus Sungbacteria bacterium]|uniref:Glycosyltransferase family 39 protein n=1 Tax=Candidatus Sungiibacteriota bacterium TaxID=2750080 RepID=A0A9D6LQD4_9BACT|nr:glycosyltransferase family 39 protein [Candidatus Sungbacteria bacterium]